ncbi:MAG TPA: tetratricopeptide repeat protein [Caulobacteraceae bacterium]|nr:tetratricopeptide repeat protein [Caulobacteraceae bacterium]
MKASAALALVTGVSLCFAPIVVDAMGSGGGGGGGMPSGMSGMSEQYDPAQEYQRGESALQAGKYRDAEDAFQHVVDSTPRAAKAWLMLGLSRAGVGDEKGAQKAFERSVKLDDSAIDAHRELALAYVKLKLPDKANAELAALKTRATACNDTCPDAADLKAAIGAIEAAMGAGGASAANAVLPSLSLATPQMGDGAYVRAVSLINEHRWNEALAALDKAEMAIGPHPDILTYEGYVWRRKGDWARAESFYQQALAMNPNHRGATEYYGELKVLEGDLAGAKRLLAKLDAACDYGCAEAEELRLWIDHGGDPAS